MHSPIHTHARTHTQTHILTDARAHAYTHKRVRACAQLEPYFSGPWKHGVLHETINHSPVCYKACPSSGGPTAANKKKKKKKREKLSFKLLSKFTNVMDLVERAKWDSVKIYLPREERLVFSHEKKKKEKKSRQCAQNTSMVQTSTPSGAVQTDHYFHIWCCVAFVFKLRQRSWELKKKTPCLCSALCIRERNQPFFLFFSFFFKHRWFILTQTFRLCHTLSNAQEKGEYTVKKAQLLSRNGRRTETFCNHQSPGDYAQYHHVRALRARYHTFRLLSFRLSLWSRRCLPPPPPFNS